VSTLKQGPGPTSTDGQQQAQYPTETTPGRRSLRMLAGATGGALVGAALVAACSTAPDRPPLTTASQVDLQRYMGDWYVIASIPTFAETEAYNAVESYRLRDDGVHVDTTFTFHKGGFDGPQKRYTPVGTVVDQRSHAVWTMRFIWPIEADYRIMRIAPDYSWVVVGREKRDHAWIMARSPDMPDAEYGRLVEFLIAEGYDVSELRRVPQRW